MQFMRFLFVITMIYVSFINNINAGKTRYCSTNLGNALSLVCMGRGYNEPSDKSYYEYNESYSIGAADECCRDGCSYDDLEKYCKPLDSSSKYNFRLAMMEKLKQVSHDKNVNKPDKLLKIST
ncbi:insulin-like growth factor I [Aphidius gifuensis]|uniref:insulin-like growth factor I n=1 Tax=Aphidius gifuensis TaxID=684658 RepID=UPI001CDC309B|nr:insulin-like growth factor I [Aphidius gifuensis]